MPSCGMAGIGTPVMCLPEAVTWARSASSARPLIGIGLTDGIDLQRIHAYTGIENLQGTRKTD